MIASSLETGGESGVRRAGAPPVRVSRRAVTATALALAAAALACSAPREPPAPTRTLLEGLNYSEFVGTSLARRISADQVLVLPKRFGMFQVSALSELVLTRARVEVFDVARPDRPRARAALDAVAPDDGFAVPGLASVRHLAGATFHGLEVIVHREGAPLARIEAGRATADARGNLDLEGFRLEHLSSGRIVRAARATWRRRTGDIVVSGTYTLVEGARTQVGRSLRIDADFVPHAP